VKKGKPCRKKSASTLEKTAFQRSEHSKSCVIRGKVLKKKNPGNAGGGGPPDESVSEKKVNLVRKGGLHGLGVFPGHHRGGKGYFLEANTYFQAEKAILASLGVSSKKRRKTAILTLRGTRGFLREKREFLGCILGRGGTILQYCMKNPEGRPKRGKGGSGHI